VGRCSSVSKAATATADPDAGSTAHSNLSSLRLLVGDHRGAIAALSVSSLLSGVTEAALLAAIAQVAAVLLSDAGQVQIGLGPEEISLSVGTLLIIAAAMGVARLGLQALISLLGAQIAARVQARLRTTLFAAFTRASWQVQSRDSEGHLQELLTSQVIQATLGTIQAAILISCLLTFVALVVSAMLLNLLAAAVVLAVAAVFFLLLRPMSALGQRRARELSTAQLDFAGGVGEASRMAEENHVFGVTGEQRSQVDALVGASERLFFRTQLVSRLIPSLYQGLIYLTVVAGLAALYLTGAGQVASLGAVVLLLVRAGTYGQQVQASYQLVRQAMPFVERLRDSTDRYLASQEPFGDRPLPSIEMISFERVSFSYRPGRAVLTDVDFEIPRGEAVGVIGPSGAGKSTLVQLLLQLRRPDHGRHLVNGRPAHEFALQDWHRRVAYVPQEPRLLHASVADNIRFRRELSDDAVERAAKLARIHEEIMDWSEGYETIVGPRADSVSGGQQQRLCLARALAAYPGLLVLDEPTSSLDPNSEALIQDSLAELGGDLTIVIVTHRMSTLSICDRVMVVADGRLDAFDTLETLRRTNEYFGSASALSLGASAS